MPILLRATLARIADCLARTRTSRDFDQELETHLSLLTDLFIRQGIPPKQAAYAARQQFGGLAQRKQERYESRRSALEGGNSLNRFLWRE